MKKAVSALALAFPTGFPDLRLAGFGQSIAGAWHSGDLPILSNLSIRVRFALLVGMALIGAAAFAGVFHVVEGRIDSLLVAQDGFRRLNDLAGDVRAKAAALQNHEEHFLRERDKDSAQGFRADVAFIASSLETMEKLPSAAPLSQQVATLRQGFAQVGQRFDAVERRAGVLGLTASAGLRGQLAGSVKAVEDELKMWPNAGPLLPTMLQMRQAEKNFMLYEKDSYIGMHRKYSNQFDFELDASALPNSTREDLRKLLVAYAEDMKSFAGETMALNAEVVALRQDFQALRPVLTQVFGHARDGMNQAIGQQEAARRQMSNLMAVFNLAALAAFCLVALVLARSITQPVRLIEDAMERLAGGDHTVLVPGIARRDEIGDMAKAVAVFKDNAIAMVRMQQEQEAIRAEAEAVNHARMLALADHFEQAVGSVAEAVNTNAQAIKETAARMVRRDRAGDSRSLSVAEAAERSRNTVAAVAEAAAELTSSVEEIAHHVTATSEVVRLAVNELERTNAQVTGLSQVASNIDRVVNLISDIAGRTNMLALNATIEAQRAGEAGKGFAVVADEVKHLAQKTADSTREIAEQISAIQNATADTAAAIGDVGDAIRRMDDIAAKVAQAVVRQSEVTDKISRCVEEVTAGTQDVTGGVVGVTQSAARYCGGAVRVMWAADDLAGPAANLKHEVDGFLRTIRA
ncbi:methyl-accepting chemotaxis protein [Magnetospirillum sulfuroxidans]|uniref:Methyl-accepting chemotaxis protein n=1 Tax=Magnetospirillum sulfuroxidans TaxID=611300 RepID=A0ABS5I7X9_9PROT|nr:methyl-accepting chemotaxis protein [Magnetospirillum sulfuroxidans]